MVRQADRTTDMTTSHLTNPAKDAGEVIGYSHSTKLPKYGSKVAGYHHERIKSVLPSCENPVCPAIPCHRIFPSATDRKLRCRYGRFLSLRSWRCVCQDIETGTIGDRPLTIKGAA